MKSPSSVRRHLPAGVIDAGIASVASFAAGLTGVNLLTDGDRGVYGVFFTAFMLGGIIVSELIYVPAQVVAVAAKKPERLGTIPQALRLGLGPSAVGAMVAVAAGVLTIDETSSEVIVALVVTTATTIIFSPMQNHVRKMLHIAERSWDAARVSIVQLLVVGAAIAVLVNTDIHRAWIPFGSLASANIASLSFGRLISGVGSGRPATISLRFRELATSGKWLVLRASAPAAFAFVAANVLVELAGSVAYGHAEAARQVAQPIIVLATGLVAVLGPHSMRAGMTLDVRTSGRAWRGYALAIVGSGVAYVALVGWSWPLNPMLYIVPSAYNVEWLVSVTIAANVLTTLVMLLTSELIGAGRTKLLAGLSMATSPTLLLVALTAGVTGAFARPLGLITEGTARLIGSRLLLRRHYDPAGAQTAAPADGVPAGGER